MTLATDRRSLLLAAAALAVPGAAFAADDWRWLNAPKSWTWRDGTLACAAEPGSDFWRKTVGGPVVDSGHFFFRRQAGDFVLTAVLDGDYAADADQTGLMLRVDAATWMKHGVEWLKGKPHVASVFTRDWSDGTAFEVATGKAVRVRVARQGQTVICSHAFGDGEWVVDRYGYLPMGESVEVGVVAAAPLGKGFSARISKVEIKGA
ncbi:DUF1349 domain-containing protein [Caulobacter sp.]|uniref:DUF1349 domain-containing protein n=1 Tax=Caulobacter sp. TaxID=78 RepID=UPI001B255B80|nr:DUF1349 domain-containing protein [Caulobacter sp.]MBO9543617.1 DUF1349 domain-containing protein [Caulobacter sp.]